MFEFKEIIVFFLVVLEIFMQCRRKGRPFEYYIFNTTIFLDKHYFDLVKVLIHFALLSDSAGKIV